MRIHDVFLVPAILACVAKPTWAAHYVVTNPAGNGAPPLTDAWVVPEGSQDLDGKTCHAWRLMLKKTDGAFLAARAVSDRVPMMSAKQPADFARYIFSPKPETVLDYVDSRTGKALLPELDFVKSFLPRPSTDAVYVDGFADSGTLLGHLVTLVDDGVEPPTWSLDNPKRLVINTDFIIATGSDVKDDGVMAKGPDWSWNFVPVTQEDVKAKIDAGFTYFGINDRIRSWVENEAVYIAGTPIYPDDLYRSNFTATGMFIDEPMVCLGWEGGIPASARGPEIVAQALRTRVASQDTLKDRLLAPPGVAMGTLQLIRHKCPSWDTESWSGWYQLQAGATGIIHEGRYKHRGYGWEPEDLLGPGLEKLTDADQYNFFFAFLRGAARSFNGDWGTSLYGHSDVNLRVPAFIRAYEMGAKYLWFWTTDHEHHMPFSEQLRIAREITAYARQHPRGDRDARVRHAAVGIAVPPGYAWNLSGVWGMEREQINRSAVSYGDIAAAAFWEGVLCSRRGIDYDFLVDHAGIEKLGYSRLIRIREDGRAEVTPPWPDKRTPTDLNLTVTAATQTIDVNQAARTEFAMPWAGTIDIDGDLADWSNAKWISLGNDKWSGDSYDFSCTLKIAQTPVSAQGNKFQGFSFAQLTPEMKAQYRLESQPHESFIAVTAIEPGSPADRAGLKVGDAIGRIGEKRTMYEFQIWELADAINKAPAGAKEFEVHGRRSGRTLYGGSKDLSAEIAFLLDERFVCFAARVADDVHIQSMEGNRLWMQDSVQIGFRPMLAGNPDAYTEHDHEFGFALRNGTSLAWRWKGRRGQPVGIMNDVTTKIVRNNGTTVYETAIPITELMPLAPGLWSQCAIDVVVNDSDRGDKRKGRLELVPGAMTQNKHPGRFAAFECARSVNAEKLSAAIQWNRRCLLEHGFVDLTIVTRAGQATQAVVEAKLTLADDPQAAPLTARQTVPAGDRATQHGLHVATGSPAGRYRLEIRVLSPDGHAAAADAMKVYIYPEQR